jgi:hypothetical protein
VAFAVALPIVLVLTSIAAQSGVALVAAVTLQYLGLLGKRWMFCGRTPSAEQCITGLLASVPLSAERPQGLGAS